MFFLGYCRDLPHCWHINRVSKRINWAHINPAITVGIWSIKKISNYDAICYLISECIGAALALFVLSETVVMPHLIVSVAYTTMLAELLGTFFLSFGIALVVYKKTPSRLSGVVVGCSLLLGISIAGIIGSNKGILTWANV